MKTWWDYWPALAFVFALPFAFGALPTVKLLNTYYGGGVIRQYAINTIATFFPTPAGQEYIDAFEHSSKLGEFILYSPIALNISAVLLTISYLLISLVIYITNLIKRKEYKSQRNASKGI